MGIINPGVGTYQWPKELKAAGAILWKLNKNIVSSDHLIVNADERAVFMRDGKVYGVLAEGEHTLTSANVPFLGKLMEIGTGRKFIGEVYYVWTKEFADQKFGTSEPMVFKDADFGLVRLRAFGSFSYQVTDPQVFVTKFVGTLSLATSDQIVGWLKGQLVRALNDALGELKAKGLTVVDMPAQLDEISSVLLSKVRDDLKPYGVEVMRIGELNINLPEEVQKAIDQRSSMGALGLNDPNMRGAYMTMQGGKMMEGAGQGMAKGGNGAGMAGLGAGMGMGMMMPQMMGQTMQQSQPPKKQCPKCSALNDINTKFCAECGAPFMAASGKCPKCSASVPAGNKFCPECGSKV
jgi:membrane protease subunit (stomatin/prohibitin family)